MKTFASMSKSAEYTELSKTVKICTERSLNCVYVVKPALVSTSSLKIIWNKLERFTMYKLKQLSIIYKALTN